MAVDQKTGDLRVPGRPGRRAVVQRRPAVAIDDACARGHVTVFVGALCVLLCVHAWTHGRMGGAYVVARRVFLALYYLNEHHCQGGTLPPEHPPLPSTGARE